MTLLYIVPGEVSCQAGIANPVESLFSDFAGFLLVGGRKLIKALFFDLDGTLLTSTKKLSGKTKTALKTCKDAGIKVFAATARPPLLSKMLKLTTDEEEILQDGGVFYNGGCICCNDNKIYTFLPEEVVSRSIEVIKPYESIRSWQSID